MPSLSCPLCSISLSPASLEAHLRQELLYPAVRCQLCSGDFASYTSAEEHFRGPLAKHPGEPPRLLYLEKDPVKEARLLELVRLARGGAEEVQKRLCLCGQCLLLCHEKQSSRNNRASEGQETTDAESQIWQPVDFEEEAKEEQAPEQAIEQPQPADEPSEPENQIMMDIKPDLKDLKPQLNADGKVACIQCGLRVGKENFKKHAIGAHSTSRPFSCNLCPHNEKIKSILAKHQRKDHGMDMSSETFTFVGSELKLAEIVEQCFGAAKDADWARARCQPCDKIVNKMHLKNHAASDHLSKVLHACRLCQYTSKRFSADDMNKHVKNKHKSQPGPDTIDSSQAQHYAPIIKNMIPQLFSQD